MIEESLQDMKNVGSSCIGQTYYLAETKKNLDNQSNHSMRVVHVLGIGVVHILGSRMRFKDCEECLEIICRFVYLHASV